MQSKTSDARSEHCGCHVEKFDVTTDALLEVEYLGDPGVCDVCGRLLSDELFFCDAALSAQDGRWGVLCKTCTCTEGIVPGWGIAQFYELQSNTPKPSNTASNLIVPRWRCIAGLT